MIPLLAASTPSPSPSDVTIDGTPLGSPGFLGFVFTFALALAVVFLFLSLTKQLRIVDRRAKALGLDDDDDRTAGPHADLGMVDAGPGGPDLEVDADVAVAPWDIVGDDEPGRAPRQGPGGSRPSGPTPDDKSPERPQDDPGSSR
ncbi:hypothetical protein [Cellulomonas sp. Leaf395]|uniref:hypothetical protein n=1 Tax=Cellulomonas sp. Leaf395 TaxID=1736362 RepID=UPI0007002929|nr:hypothetical protein [Cellulomonas sp. Leaf395]KQT02377.1 hypothetical protein ASG23_03360 [Cellulomonas sp. Leaf395]